MVPEVLKLVKEKQLYYRVNIAMHFHSTIPYLTQNMISLGGGQMEQLKKAN